MPIPIILVTVIILSILLRQRMAYTSQKVEKEKQAFIKREQEANQTRKQDISSLNYIKIPLDTLPMNHTDEALIRFQDRILALSKEQILNLSGFSNTDLKLKYGVANINFLSKCDSNYTQLVNTLYKWASRLYELNLKSDAKAVLEYGIQCNTDISKHYTLLAIIYREENAFEKIDELSEKAGHLSTLMKESILSSLNEIKNSIR